MGLEFDIECGERAADAATACQPALDGSRSLALATLFDRFNSAVAEPERHTIGSFAETVMALHAELSLLAEHFSTVAARVGEDATSDGRLPAMGDPLAEFDALEAIGNRP